MIRSRNAQPYFRFVVHDKAGFIDRAGKIVVAPQLRPSGNYGGEFRDGWLNLWPKGYVDVRGHRLPSADFQLRDDFSEGLAAVQLRGPLRPSEKYGYIDQTGHMVIAPQFDRAREFSDGMARVIIGNKTGYVDRSGTLVIPATLSDGTDFHEGLAAAILEGNCRHAGALCGGDHFAPADNPDGRCQYAIIDKSGGAISGGRYDSVQEFSEGMAAVETGGKWGFIDRTGSTVLAPRFEYAKPFSDGLALVKSDGRWGYVSRHGEYVIRPQFEDADSFSEGLAWAGSQDQGYSYIRKDGKPAFAGRFAIASPFRFGLAHVMVERKNRREATFAYIDTTGRKVFTYTGRL